MRLRTAVPLRRLLTRSRHVQRDRLTAAQAKPRRGGDRSGALVARDAKGYVSSPSPSSERRDCGSPLLARQFRSPAFKETFCYSRGATTNRRTYPTAYWLPLLLSPTLPGGAFFFVVRAAPTRVPMCASRTPGTSRRRPSAHGAARAVDKDLTARPVAPHSITSSASASSLSGTARPSAFVVLRLITSSNFVGCWNGKSPGFSPFSTLATYEPGPRYIATGSGPYAISTPSRATRGKPYIVGRPLLVLFSRLRCRVQRRRRGDLRGPCQNGPCARRKPGTVPRKQRRDPNAIQRRLITGLCRSRICRGDH